MLRERAPVTVPPDRTLVDDVERRVGAPLLADARRLQRRRRRGRVLHSGHRANPGRRRRRRGQSLCRLRVARPRSIPHALRDTRLCCRAEKFRQLAARAKCTRLIKVCTTCRAQLHKEATCLMQVGELGQAKSAKSSASGASMFERPAREISPMRGGGLSLSQDLAICTTRTLTGP